MAEVQAPEVVLDTVHTIGLRGDGQVPYTEGLEMADLVRRLDGHVVRVDHTGVNLPASEIPLGQWRSRIR